MLPARHPGGDSMAAWRPTRVPLLPPNNWGCAAATRMALLPVFDRRGIRLLLGSISILTLNATIKDFKGLAKRLFPGSLGENLRFAACRRCREGKQSGKSRFAEPCIGFQGRLLNVYRGS